MKSFALLRALCWVGGAWLLLLGQGQARPSLSFFCEVSGEQLLQFSQDAGLLQSLQDLDAELRIGILDFSEARTEAVKRLNQAGIPVVAWLLLPAEEGYWLHATNGKAALDRYRDFRRWTEVEGLVWEGIGLDLEPPLADVQGWFDAPLATSWRAYLRLLKGSSLEAWREPYQRLLLRIRDDGYPVESYVFPPVFDERAAETASFQRLLGLLDLTVDQSIPMCYSSAPFIEPAMILSYGEQVSAIALGSTGGGPALNDGKPLPSLDWEALSRDLLLAQQVCQTIHLYSLEGCIEQGFLPRLQDFDWQQSVAIYSGDIQAVPRDRQRLSWALQALDYPILSSVLVLLFLIGGFWLLIRLLTWPFRGPKRGRSRRKQLSDEG